MSFCTSCGKEKTKEWTGRFDSKSGEKEMREVCPDQPCDHSGHLWQYKDVKRWTDYLPWVPVGRCSRCEKEGNAEIGFI